MLRVRLGHSVGSSESEGLHEAAIKAGHRFVSQTSENNNHLVAFADMQKRVIMLVFNIDAQWLQDNMHCMLQFGQKFNVNIKKKLINQYKFRENQLLQHFTQKLSYELKSFQYNYDLPQWNEFYTVSYEF